MPVGGTQDGRAQHGPSSEYDSTSNCVSLVHLNCLASPTPGVGPLPDRGRRWFPTGQNLPDLADFGVIQNTAPQLRGDTVDGFVIDGKMLAIRVLEPGHRVEQAAEGRSVGNDCARELAAALQAYVEQRHQSAPSRAAAPARAKAAHPVGCAGRAGNP